MKTAQDYKAEGNAAFNQKNFQEAADLYTKAIELDGNDAVFYSNRSGCFVSLEKYEQALEDAEKCLQINPNFVKGYSRKALALYKLDKDEDAVKAIDEGLKIDPNNEQLKKDRAIYASPAVPEDFMQNLSSMMNNPEISKLLQSNPQLLQQFMQNPGMAQMMMNMMKGQGAPGGPSPSPSPSHAETPKEEPKAEKKPEPAAPLSRAEELKNEGNSLYKQKKFEEAIAKYDEAIKEDEKNMLVRNNKAACLIELKRYAEAHTTVDEAIEKFKELDFSDRTPAHLSKLLTRRGRIFFLENQLVEAIKAFEDALLEDTNEQAEQYLKETRRMKKKQDEEAYIDPTKSEEHRKKGNEFFEKGEWGKALEEYEEAAKRNPNDPKIFNNRATTFIKIMNYGQAMVEVEKALKIDPTFTNALLKKATIHNFTKEFHKALDIYKDILKRDPSNADALKGIENTNQKIAMAMHSQPDEEQMKRAMADPEIQAIVADPMVRIALEQMQQNPRASQDYMKDSSLGPKIMKLIQAGIIRTA